MTGCCIKGCNNSTKKGFRYFTVPVDKKRHKEWLQLIGRDTLGKKASVCEVHFDEDQFEQHRKDGKKLLRPFGKPNLLRTSENERDERRVNPQDDNSEQTTDLSNVQDINSSEVHFDEDQFEQHRKDGKKLLRPFEKPNLLRTSKNERDEHRVNPQKDNSEQTTDLSNIQNINSYKF